jgi:hypothetical protein
MLLLLNSVINTNSKELLKVLKTLLVLLLSNLLSNLWPNKLRIFKKILNKTLEIQKIPKN